jgi:hypothetical protein
MSTQVPGAINIARCGGSEIVGLADGPQVAQTTVGGLMAAPQATGGTVTLNGVTPVNVANTAVTANSLIVFTLKTVGGTVGAHPVIETITPGTGFTVAGTAADTSVYNYGILG